MGWIFIGLFVVFFAVSFLWGLLRGVAKTRIRIAAVGLSFLLALLSTVFLKTLLAGPWSMENLLVPLLNSNNITILGDILNMSATLNEVLSGCVGAAVAPVLFVICFVIWSLITWVVYTIVTLCIGGTLRRQNKELRLKPVRLLPYAAVSALVLVVVLMVPVSVYAGIAPTVADELVAAGILKDKAADTTNQILDDYVEPLDESFAVKSFRTLGGNGICKMLTDFQVKDSKTNLSDEVGTVTSFGCNIYRLSQTKVAEYTSKEATVILAIADSFDNSELLPTIVGEVVYNAADAWLQDQNFLSIAKPEMGELFEPFFDTVLRVLKNDAQNKEALQEDIRTLAELISTLAEHEILAHLSDPAVLLTQLDEQGALDQMITCLGKNPRMNVLIPEITNLGIRAMADNLGIPADNLALYQGFLGEIANSLNQVSSIRDEAQRTEAMTAALKTAFDNAGIEADASLLSCYSASMVSDMLNADVEKSIEAQDVRAFFALYSMNADQGSNTVFSGSRVELLSGAAEEDLFAGTVYEKMSAEQLANTGAAVLAGVTKALSEMPSEGDTDAIRVQATAIITNAYSGLLGSDSAVMVQLEAVVIEAPLPQETLDFATNLSSPDAVGEMSSRITVDKLVVDAQSFLDNAGVNIDIAAEGEVIRTVINVAGTVLGSEDPTKMDLNTIASSAGQIMDALSNSGFFGEEQTAVLFQAVLQSDQVRDTAGLDMNTANQLAQKATETPEGEKVNYTATMNSVSASITIVTQMGNGEEIKDEDLIDMIKNLTPSSAGMIEVYATADRLVGFGVPAEYSEHSAKMIASVFGHLAHDKLSEEQFEKEAKALNQILSISMASKDSSGKKLFGEILPGAEECIGILMDSTCIQKSLKENMTDGTQITVFDPYGLSGKLNGATEAQEVIDALHAYHQHHPEADTLVLKSIAATFGVEIVFQ